MQKVEQHDEVYHLSNVVYRFDIEDQGLLVGTPERSQWLGEKDQQHMKNVGWTFGFSNIDDAKEWGRHMVRHIPGCEPCMVAAYVVRDPRAIWRPDQSCAGATFEDVYSSAVMSLESPLPVDEVMVNFI